LEEETFVMRETVSGTRIAMERFLREKGVKIRSGMEMTSNEAIKLAVEAGLGLGIVSIHTVQLELETDRLRVLDVDGFPILRHWYVVYRRGKRLTAVAEAFKAFVVEHGGRLTALQG